MAMNKLEQGVIKDTHLLQRSLFACCFVFVVMGLTTSNERLGEEDEAQRRVALLNPALKREVGVSRIRDRPKIYKKCLKGHEEDIESPARQTDEMQRAFSRACEIVRAVGGRSFARERGRHRARKPEQQRGKAHHKTHPHCACCFAVNSSV